MGGGLMPVSRELELPLKINQELEFDFLKLTGIVKNGIGIGENGFFELKIDWGLGLGTPYQRPQKMNYLYY